MKGLLVNGSPHKEGCTYTALKEVEKEKRGGGRKGKEGRNEKIDPLWLPLGQRQVALCK